MGLASVTFATCDTCEERSAAFSSAIYNRLDVAKALHTEGWTRHLRTHGGSGFAYACPACAARAAKRAKRMAA